MSTEQTTDPTPPRTTDADASGAGVFVLVTPREPDGGGGRRGRHRRAHRVRLERRRGGVQCRRLAASGAASAAGDAIAAADIPVGGGKVFDDLKVVDHPADRRRLQGVLGHVHPPGLHGQRRVERRHHLPVPRLDLRHRHRCGRSRGPPPRRCPPRASRWARTASPSPEPGRPRPTSCRAAVVGLPAWLTRRRTVPGRARSRPTPASTGSATRTAGSSTSARPRTCGSGCPRTSRTSRRCTTRTATMVRTGASVEWTVVTTEVEALQLEYTWIKEFDPRFNVKYRDDKSYPYLAVTLGEEFPRAQVMRGAKRKGTRYFGPYAHAWAIRETLDLAAARLPGAHLLAPGCSSAPARSAGPACSATSTSAAAPVRRPGRRRASTARSPRTSATSWPARPGGSSSASTGEMKAAAAELDFERAARLRDDIGALERVLEKSAVVLPDATDADVVRPRRGRARGRGAGLPRARRPGARPARLGGREGDAETTAEVVEHLLQQVYGERGRRRRAARGARAGAARRRRGARAVARRRCAAAGSTCGCRSAATSGP